MCFTNDSDWYAELEESSDEVVEVPTKCDECRRPIVMGETAHIIHMEQYEQCRCCYEDDERDEEAECACEEPDHGETFDYVRCQGCSAFLDAVEAAEVEEGCKRYEARPNLTALFESLQEIGYPECRRYWQKAAKMFPERKLFFVWLWRNVFKYALRR